MTLTGSTDLYFYSSPSKNRTPLLRHFFSNPTVSEVSSLSLFPLSQVTLLIRPLPANGITLNGFKFMCIQATPEEVIGRKGVSFCSIFRPQLRVVTLVTAKLYRK